MNDAHTIKIALATVVVLNVVLGGLFGFVFLKIQDLSQEVASQEKNTLEAVAQDTKKKQLADTIKSIEPAEEKIKEYFVERSNSVEFVEYLEGLAEKAGVVADPNINKVTGALQFNISYEGGFDDVLRYIALIESLPYNEVVESVYLEEIDQEVGLWRGSMRITLPGSGND
jgi:hypothetical protein